jgi:hypothetical protein
MENPPESGDLRDTPKHVILRPEDWIVQLERRLGYLPCVHPEDQYGRYRPDPAAVIDHPIARDPAIATRRGEPVPDPGPKPSLMERRRQGLCALCGSSEFDYEPGREDAYSDPMGLAGIYACRRCGTRWFRDQWPEMQALEASQK